MTTRRSGTSAQVTESAGLPATAGLDGLKDQTAAEAALEPSSPAAHRVGWGFISLYTLAYMSTNLLFLAPLLVTLALKVDSLVGNQRAPASLALVAAVGALLAMVANPFFGRMSDRTASPLGMRRPWMVSGLVGGSLGIGIIALAPSIPVVLLGWCITQVCFNALRHHRSVCHPAREAGPMSLRIWASAWTCSGRAPIGGPGRVADG